MLPGTDNNNPAGAIQLTNLLSTLIGLLVPLAFIILVILLAYAGFKYITSGGDSKGLQSAHSTITWALLGILFLIVAWLIFLLIQAFTGVNVTKFCVGIPGSNLPWIKCP
jgi:uncharacterized BrkB/YihY/UPF0761 family membrane protein